MNWRYFFIFQVIILLMVTRGVYLHQDKVQLVKIPPVALAQWYKPESKRQVWLHNMFKLRREMQAVQFYAQKQEVELMQKWVGQLNKHYFKIGEMVPVWQKKLLIENMAALTNASEQGDFSAVLVKHKILQKNCTACHDDYQAITALTYRTPNFSNIKITEEVSFSEHMSTLSQQVNQIKISAQDGNNKLALASLDSLKLGMVTLGNTCVNCHKTESKPYPSELMEQTLNSLQSSLESGTAKQKSRNLGALAVQACARCHGTHRLAYGIKKKLTTQASLVELVKH